MKDAAVTHSLVPKKNTSALEKMGLNQHWINVYILMPNKSQDSYIRVLTKLKEINPAASPDRVLVEFETAPINADGQVFDTAEIKGCLFHQGQNLNKKVAELGLNTQFQTNVEFNMAVKPLLALAFVPENDVLVLIQELKEKFQAVIHENPELKRANELLIYVDLYYIKGRERQGRGRALPNNLLTWGIPSLTLEVIFQEPSMLWKATTMGSIPFS